MTNTTAAPTTTDRTRRTGRPITIVATLLVAAVAAVVHVVLQASMLFRRPDFAWSSFRTYFSGDQLSYMSMVVNAYAGRSDGPEPFTETGVNNYPHLWYVILGNAARILGINPLQAWAVGGLFVQMVLVAVLAVTIVLVTRRTWAGLLAPLPFVVGTFAMYVDQNWFMGLDSHAVLWGAFGVLFTLNGESVALCLSGIAMLLLVVAWTRLRRRSAQIVLTVVASAVLGSLANFQTYAFLVSIYLVAFVVAVVFLLLVRRTWLTVVSVALVPVVFLVGPVFAASAGPLATLLFGLLPAVPGLVAGIVRTRGLLAVFGVVAVAASAPQLVGTVGGILGDDPFLTYRVASSKNLGVDPRGILGAAALLLPLLGILAAGVLRRRLLWIAYPVGVLVAWALMATNDRWGANQEPYRFWLDTFLLVCVTVLPFAGSVLVGLVGRRADDAVVRDLPRGRRSTAGSDRTVVEAAADADGPETTVETGDRRPSDASRRPAARRTTVVTWAALVACVLVAGASTADFVKFYNDPLYQGLINYNTVRDHALRDATAPMVALGPSEETGLLVSDPCIEVLGLKIVSGAPVAHFNLGMAWPEDKPAVELVMQERAEGVLDFAHASDANVKWVVTDSACTTADWSSTYGAGLSAVETADYDLGAGPATITLWRVED